MFGIAHTFGTPFGPMRAFLGLLLAVPLFANDPTSLAKEADVLMRNGSYAEALKFYDEAFVLDSNRRGLRYNAAIAAAMSGQIDRAFDCLDQAFPAQADWSLSFERVSQDRRLQPLREAERWSEFYAELQRRKVEYESGPLPGLKQELLAIFNSDQSARKHLSEIEKTHGAKSLEVEQARSALRQRDAANLRRVEAILEAHGWLGPMQVGSQASVALWLVIQHADLVTQQRHLSLIRGAVADGKVRPSELALLEDRVAFREGRKQIYGSQIGRDPEGGSHYVLPLDDPRHVDTRRSAVGLNPLGEYVKRWGIAWDPDDYLEKLPQFEKWAEELRTQSP